MSNAVTVLTDGNGLQREYRQVSRKAKVGERVLIAKKEGGPYGVGDVLYAIYADRWENSGWIGGTGISADTSPRVATSWSDGFGVNHTEYVVLEPSDIVVIDGGRFRLVERKAVLGERILAIGAQLPYFNTGDLAKVISSGRSDVFADFNGNRKTYNGGRWYADHENYRVLETVLPRTPTQPSTDELVTLLAKLAADNVAIGKRLFSLEENVAGHERKIGTMDVQLRVAREDIILVETGAFDHVSAVEKRVAALESPSPVINVTVNGRISGDDVARHITEAIRKTSFGSTPTKPTLSRQDVINNAKADVVALLDANYTHIHPTVWLSKKHGVIITDRCEFVVDSANRIVTALIRELNKQSVIHTGKSICAPDDVFNVFIGKAIALRRALGLDVPADYLKSPQPTEPQIGDVVTGVIGGGYYSPNKTFTLTAPHNDDAYKYAELSTDYIYRRQIGRIIDDSRESTVAAC